MCSSSGFRDGSALQALFHLPYAVAYRPGGADELYISDRNNNRVRLLRGGNVSTVIGTDSSAWNGDGVAASVNLNEPTGLAWAPDGSLLYFSDSQHHVVRVYDPGAGTVLTVAGLGDVSGNSGNGGPATAAMFNLPTGLAFAADGFSLLVADTFNDNVRQLTALPQCATQTPFITVSPSSSASRTTTATQTGSASSTTSPTVTPTVPLPPPPPTSGVPLATALGIGLGLGVPAVIAATAAATFFLMPRRAPSHQKRVPVAFAPVVDLGSPAAGGSGGNNNLESARQTSASTQSWGGTGGARSSGGGVGVPNPLNVRL